MLHRSQSRQTAFVKQELPHLQPKQLSSIRLFPKQLRVIFKVSLFSTQPSLVSLVHCWVRAGCPPRWGPHCPPTPRRACWPRCWRAPRDSRPWTATSTHRPAASLCAGMYLVIGRAAQIERLSSHEARDKLPRWKSYLPTSSSGFFLLWRCIQSISGVHL